MEPVRRRAWANFRAHFGRQGYGVAIAVVVIGPLVYWAAEGTKNAKGQVATWVLTGVIPLAGLLLVAAVWSFGTALFGVMRDEVAALTARVGALEAAPPGVNSADQLRVALMAVRSELGSCGTIISEALTRKRWWMPDSDPLPAAQWDRHFAALSDPSLPTDLHAAIEVAYQRCNRLNHRIGRYIAQHKQTQFLPMVPASIYQLHEGDEEALREALATITKANGAISARVDGAPS